MGILQIAILAVLAILAGQLRKGRELVILAISALAVFWLQPSEPFATLQYWLPLATLGIAVVCWALTSTPEVRSFAQNWPAVAILLGVAAIGELIRYTGWQIPYFLHAPSIKLLLPAVVGLGLVAWLLTWAAVGRRALQWAALLAIILLLVVLKAPALSQAAQAYASTVTGATRPDTTSSLAWLGFSYVAFRLMHTIRDRQSGRMPPATLGEYVNYVIFFPSFTAGPIDRIERFLKDLCAPLHLTDEDWLFAGTRLFVGLFKKFVIADMLAVVSINDVLVRQVKSTPWMWVLLYAYAFRIYFDFSGYTDIAIGMARLMGVHLPENFTAPYLKPNLTQFWNSWHITLTQWFRGYFFNPLTRALRSTDRPIPTWLIILVTQLSTMLLIGLWHGITLGFMLWGLWHGLGLFIHNRWSDFMRSRSPASWQTGRARSVLDVVGVVLTFNFVAVGWTFFALSTPALAWTAIGKLFGFV